MVVPPEVVVGTGLAVTDGMEVGTGPVVADGMEVDTGPVVAAGMGVEVAASPPHATSRTRPANSIKRRFTGLLYAKPLGKVTPCTLPIVPPR